LADEVPLMFQAEKGQFWSPLLFNSLNRNVVSTVHSNYPPKKPPKARKVLFSRALGAIRTYNCKKSVKKDN
jgi:hypothetical protein